MDPPECSCEDELPSQAQHGLTTIPRCHGDCWAKNCEDLMPRRTKQRSTSVTDDPWSRRKGGRCLFVARCVARFPSTPDDAPSKKSILASETLGPLFAPMLTPRLHWRSSGRKGGEFQS